VAGIAGDEFFLDTFCIVSQQHANLELASVFTSLTKDIELPVSIAVFTMDAEMPRKRHNCCHHEYGFHLHYISPIET
jgi:hypothetical protein